jgi:two-component system response regulator
VDGWEVLTRMRASPRTARVPVVIVSGSDRPEDIRRSYALGANSYLLKRFDPRGPGTYLAEAARYWIEMNQVTPEPEPTSW